MNREILKKLTTDYLRLKDFSAVKCDDKEMKLYAMYYDGKAEGIKETLNDLGYIFDNKTSKFKKAGK